MLETAVTCGYCNTLCQTPLTHQQSEIRCPNCNGGISLYAFPALVRQEKVGVPAPKHAEEDGSCFYHAEARAERVCDACGRFLCGLCDIAYTGKHLCTNCIQAMEDGEENVFRGEIFRYDILGFHIALLSCLLFYISLISTPIVMFLVIFGWTKSNGVIPRSRWRYVAATLISVTLFTLTIILIVVMMTGM